MSRYAAVPFVIVIVNSRFLERPQKRSRGNQLIHRRLTKTKSLDSGQDPESQAGRQARRSQTLQIEYSCFKLYNQTLA